MKTFVIRLWVATDPAVEARDPLHGVIEHVGSGRSTSFGDERELLDFLREPAGAEAIGPGRVESTSAGAGRLRSRTPERDA